LARATITKALIIRRFERLANIIRKDIHQSKIDNPAQNRH
jgi:hypothetical protein